MKSICLTVLLLCMPITLHADLITEKVPSDNDAQIEGHSYHGEAFNEGPRQKAYLMDQMGGVTFKVTTSNKQAQAFFNQGIGQLHGFWYFEAERSFRQVLAIDAECVMAYWGMAMANINNEKRARELISKAHKQRDKASDREKVWIDALHQFYIDLADSKKQLEEAKKKEAQKKESSKKESGNKQNEKNESNKQEESKKEDAPKQTKRKASETSEVKVEKVKQIDKSSEKEDKPEEIDSDDLVEKQVEKKVAEKKVASAPSKKVPVKKAMKKKKGLSKAARAKKEADKKMKAIKRKPYADYVTKLEAIVKAYPDNIEAKAFLAVRRWQNNRKDVKLDRDKNEKLIQDVLTVAPMHPIHHFRIHTWDKNKSEKVLDSAARCGQSAPGIAHMWHMPGHIYSDLKRYNEAAWQQEASARVDHAHMMRDRVMPDQIHNFAHNNEWLTRNLMHVGRIQDALDLAINMTSLPRHPKYNTLDKRGSNKYGRSRLMDVLSRFELWEDAITLCQRSTLEPTEKSDEQVKRLRLLGCAYAATQRHENADQIIEALEERLAKLDEKKRKRASEKQAIAEITAIKLQVKGEHEDALTKFKSLRNYDKVKLSMAYLLAGKQKEALKEAKSAVDKAKNSIRPLAHQAYILHQAGKLEEAQKVFAKVRKIGCNADLDNAVFKRLEPLLNDCKDKLDPPLKDDGDWRLPSPLTLAAANATEQTQRPDLDTLGPFRWSPSPAHPFRLPGSSTNSIQSELISLNDYKGKPVIVIFYLGADCLHCVEQLGAFAPMTKSFKEAGISLLGVSTDAPDHLIDSARKYDPEKGNFPFPLVSDHQLDIFKKYRAYDDFEDMTLHGTFLISPQGKVLWQDISYEPFMDAEFLLKESKRLLAQ